MSFCDLGPISRELGSCSLSGLELATREVVSATTTNTSERAGMSFKARRKRRNVKTLRPSPGSPIHAYIVLRSIARPFKQSTRMLKRVKDAVIDELIDFSLKELLCVTNLEALMCQD